MFFRSFAFSWCPENPAAQGASRVPSGIHVDPGGATQRTPSCGAADPFSSVFSGGPKMRTYPQVRSFTASLFGTLVLLAAGPALAHDRDDWGHHDKRRHHGDESFQIQVLSGRPDTVAGGDALV